MTRYIPQLIFATGIALMLLAAGCGTIHPRDFNTTNKAPVSGGM